MALRVNTNVTALNAHKNLAINDDRLSGSIEKISSGLRINRAADDAAGLTISEKLRTQVRGINRALMNTQDGISLIQTAEGALNEIHSMLQRMRELALQSSNDTLTTTDRLEIQKEIMQLKEDINRISNGTEFNTRKLLDGSGTANVSTSDPKNLDGVVVGEVLTFSDFSIVVYPQSVNIPGQGVKVLRGTAEVQRSNIFTRTDGVIATGSTTLQSISNFYDRNGNFILNIPQTLYVQGDNQQGSLVVSKDLTLNQLAERMQAAMTTDQLGKGLHFEGSKVVMNTYGETNGQFTVTSGKMGNVGRINFTGEQDLVTALGFQQVIKPEDPVYSIASTNLGVEAGLRKTLTTQIAGHRAAGLIAGVDLVFQPPTQAYAQTLSATLGISIPTGFTFDVDDSVSSTASVPITIDPGVWAMDQIVSIINTDLVANNSQVRVTLNDHYALQFYTLNTGSAAFVSISNLALLPNPLGIANGRYTGNSGYAGSTKSTNVISNFDFTANPVTFTVTDFHSATTATTINLPSSYAAGGMASLVDAINNQIVANNLQIRAFNNNGTLELRSLESGVESNFTIVDNANTLSQLYIGTLTTNSGYDGVEARQDFAYDQAAAKWGYNIADSTASAGLDHMSFYIADLDGRGMVITITEGIAALGQSFRTIQSIANIINQEASSAGVKIAAEIVTANMSMKIYSTVPGATGRVTFAELASPDSVNTLQSVFGVTPKTYQNGVGQYSYTMHLKDAFIQLQIGPNEGHSAKANIVRTDIVALGIRDLDLTTVPSSQEAIGLIDKALQYISSERAKLGAIENRLTYTTNSLRVGLENMSASESRIRDVDVAREVVELTRFQILQQSSNAMLAQANTSAQRVLDLLR